MVRNRRAKVSNEEWTGAFANTVANLGAPPAFILESHAIADVDASNILGDMYRRWSEASESALLAAFPQPGSESSYRGRAFSR